MGSFSGSVKCVLLIFIVFQCHGEMKNETNVPPTPGFLPFDRGEECEAPKFQCRNSGPCIVADAICNGDQDCPDGDDETNCGNSTTVATSGDKECDEERILCNDGSFCVRKTYVCDGDWDCEDRSDEHDCKYFYPYGEYYGYNRIRRNSSWLNQSNRKLCSKDQFRCDGPSGKCIFFNQTCNGVRDCPDGEDENERCNACYRLNCSFQYLLSHTGCTCICPDGSQLGSDGRTCSDIDECETPKGKMCQHYCDNLHKNHTCRCAEGYILGSDGHSCHREKKNEGTLIVSTLHGIGYMPLEQPGNFSIYNKTNSLFMIKGLDYMHRHGSLYLNIQHNNTEDRELIVCKDGKRRKLDVNMVGAERIAVDRIGNNIYIAQKYSETTAGITLCTSNGTFCRRIVDEKSTLQLGGRTDGLVFQDIALNPTAGIMVWIENNNHSSYRIMTANMDGTNISVLVDNRLCIPYGITFDTIKNEVYFKNQYDKVSIEKVSLKTRERSVVVYHGLYHPYDLAVFDGLLYWSDWGIYGVKVVETEYSLYSSSRVVETFDQYPTYLAINHSLYQPLPEHDLCDTIRDTCKWICVVVPDAKVLLRPKCICPDDLVYAAEINSCVSKTQEVIYKEKLLPASVWPTLLTVILAFLLFCAVLFILYQNNPCVKTVTTSTGTWIRSKLRSSKSIDAKYPRVSHSEIKDTLYDEMTENGSTKTSEASSSRDPSDSFANPLFKATADASSNLFSL